MKSLQVDDYSFSGKSRFSLDKVTPISSRKNKQGTWHGTALIIEMLVILIVVVACLGIFVRLFSYAYTSNAYDQHRASAITLATSTAEQFATQTSISTGSFTESDGSYTVTSDISATQSTRGTLYHALISVSYKGEEIYQLETARYLSDHTTNAAGVGSGGATDAGSNTVKGTESTSTTGTESTAAKSTDQASGGELAR